MTLCRPTVDRCKEQCFGSAVDGSEVGSRETDGPIWKAVSRVSVPSTPLEARVPSKYRTMRMMHLLTRRPCMPLPSRSYNMAERESPGESSQCFVSNCEALSFLLGTSARSQCTAYSASFRPDYDHQALLPSHRGTCCPGSRLAGLS